MSEPNVLVVEGAVARITMNRPERRNALSLTMMEDLIAALRSLGERPETRAVILAANGPAFSAGHDLREMRGLDLGGYRHVFEVCTRLMETVQGIAQPVIAQVQGIATAAGCQLVAACDLAVAAESATFATPGVHIGLFCSTPAVALSRAVGRKRALEMLFAGDPIDAHTAAAWGLVNRVVPADALEAATAHLAERIARASPLVLRLGKEAFYAQVDLEQAKAYAYAREVMSLNALADDAREGMAAFLEKRAPSWKGR